MQVYLVGGAVRDKLLERPVVERDYVVVGATPEQLLEQGFTQVGKDFPVFLHPVTKEEYALARTERKTGSGYTGFSCFATPDVTLEQDLLRRDLTVNAIAEESSGKLIDPFNGQRDIQLRVLRHVSQAFSEDPLRIFRVARFAARYHYLGFTIAPTTMALMQSMSRTTDIEQLSAERVWQETKRSLREGTPTMYFSVLQQSGALRAWMPELDSDELLTQSNTALGNAAVKNCDLATRWACVCWPIAADHLARLQTRLKVPNSEADIAQLCNQFAAGMVTNYTDPKWVLHLFNQCDLWRRPERLESLLTCVEIIYGSQAQRCILSIRLAIGAALSIDVRAILKSGAKGTEIKQQLAHQRTVKIAQVLQSESACRN